MEKFIDLIFRQDVKKIEALIKSGEIKADEDVNRGQRALALASACNYIDVMKCLIKNGADVNESNADDLGYTPLEEAAREGKVEAVKLLIKENAQLDKGNTINTNAFIGACICAQTDVIEILLDSGANINHADINGQTALHYLCRYAKQWGGGVITETINGITREKENSRYKKHTITFEKLLEKGADVNLETKYGYSALHLASESNAHNFIAPLIAKGAKVNIQNSKGYSPLHAAADMGNLESCIELLKNGANINIVDNDGFTPILGATASKNIELVRLFIEKGALKNIKSKINYGLVEVGDDVITLATKINNPELLEIVK